MHGKLYHHIFSGTSSLQKVSSIVPTNKRICVELTNKRDTGAGGNPSSPDSQKNKKKNLFFFTHFQNKMARHSYFSHRKNFQAKAVYVYRRFIEQQQIPV